MKTTHKNHYSKDKNCQLRDAGTSRKGDHSLLISNFDSTSVQASDRELIRVDDRRRFGARLLLIENDASAREFYTDFLTTQGFSIVVTNNRLEGLAALDQAPGVELVISAYNLGHTDRMGGIVMTDQLQSMWAEPRRDRIPSVLLLGSFERFEQELVAEEHGAYFSPRLAKREILRKIDLILFKRRKVAQQQIFFIEHLGCIPGTYCAETELIAALYLAHRIESRPVRCALRERLAFDGLAHHGNRWVSLKELTRFMQNSVFYANHDHRDWLFSPRSLKESFHLLRNGIDEAAIAVHADFRASELLLTEESGRYDRLYKLNCAVGWLHP